MRRMKCGWFLGLIASASMACGESPEEGEALVGVSVRGATAADIARAVLTVSGPGINPDLVVELRRSGGTFRGVVTGIPVGIDRTFHIDAYDAQGRLIFVGDATGVTVAAGRPVSVAIVLRQPMLPPVFGNTAPVIDSLVASSVVVPPSGTIQLAVATHDPDPGDVVRLAWTGTGGTFSSTSAAAVTWTAPAIESSYVLTLTATDLAGATVSLGQTILVQRGAARGGASVVISVNNWPQVDRMVANPGRVEFSAQTTLTVTASDLDFDPLTYAYSDGCGGSFAATASTAVWTAPAMVMGGRCDLSVSVDDGQGGSAAGTLSIEVGPPQSVDVGPQIVAIFQSAEAVNPGDTVYLEIQAFDPEGLPLSFAWTASAGTLSAAATSSVASLVTWSTLSSAGFPVLIEGTVTDASGQSFTVSFFVDDLGVAFYVRSDGNDAAPGTVAEPMRTVQAAVNRAALDPSQRRVRIAAGTYPELVSLTDGVSLSGGYDPSSWQLGGAAPTVLESASPIGLFVSGYTSAGAIEGLTIRAAAAASGSQQSSRGVVLMDVTGTLELRNNRIEAGAGRSGTTGWNGSSGTAPCLGGGGGSCNVLDAGSMGASGGFGGWGAHGGLPASQAAGIVAGNDWTALAGGSGGDGSCGGGGGGGGGNLCCPAFPLCFAACGGQGGTSGGGGRGGAGGGGAGGSIGVLAVRASGARLTNNTVITGSAGDGGGGGSGGAGASGAGGAPGVFCFAGSGGAGGTGGNGGNGGGGAGGAGGHSVGLLQVSSAGLVNAMNQFTLGAAGAGGAGGFNGGSFAPMGEAGIQADVRIVP